MHSNWTFSLHIQMYVFMIYPKQIKKVRYSALTIYCVASHSSDIYHCSATKSCIMISQVDLTCSQLDLTSWTALSFPLLWLCLRLIDQFSSIIIEINCQQCKNVDFVFNYLIITEQKHHLLDAKETLPCTLFTLVKCYWNNNY